MSSRLGDPNEIAQALPAPLRTPAEVVVGHMQQGTFQRSMALLVAGTSIVSGMEVAYEHYKGSYSNPVMYTPVVLSGVLAGAAIAGFFSRSAAQTVMRWAAYATLADGIIGFGFHVRGVARKPGGWRLPVTNIVMGPPIFAPLLFGTSAYLGVLASYLQREEDHGSGAESGFPEGDFRDDIFHGRFQKHLCVVAAIATVASGAESWYSHYKDNFKKRVQWSPVLLTPLMVAVAIAAHRSSRVANTLLPVVSATLMLDGTVGFGYHARGILARPGGARKPLYNILYGPPIFAPLLFAACGLLGMMAYLMRREKNA